MGDHRSDGEGGFLIRGRIVLPALNLSPTRMTVEAIIEMHPMDPIDKPGPGPAPVAQDEARDTRRESLFLGVEITRSTATLTGRIRNISATGALVESDVALVKGETLTLSFRGVDRIGATVVRKTAKGVGVRFEEEIDPTVCRVSVLGKPEDQPRWGPARPTSRFGQPIRSRR